MQLKGKGLKDPGVRLRVPGGSRGDTLADMRLVSAYSEKLISRDGVGALQDRLVAANRVVNRVV
jgi:hypothetical protein